MLSFYTKGLSVTLLRHQDIVDGNIQQNAECQHVVDAGQGITPQPLVHRAHIRDAEQPPYSCYRISAVLDECSIFDPVPTGSMTG